LKTAIQACPNLVTFCRRIAVSIFTSRLGGSVSMPASGSTDWIALVTVRAQPPQVMLSM
jgi:hypothetical protein